MNTFVVDLRPFVVTDEDFFELCAKNQDLRMERTAGGNVIIMPPTGGTTGIRNADLTGQLWTWNEQAQTGICFDSSTGFRLPNSAIRSPDASWVPQERWDALSQEQRERFAPLCPDFVVELKSFSDELEPLQAKMQEYIANGTQLGWLIDPQNRRVEIYRPEQTVEVLDDPQSLSGDPLLPGFQLDLERIFR